jgi:hypothetical protein
MREQDLAYKIKRYLDMGTGKVDRATAEKLFRARQAALARQKIASGGLRLAGVGNFPLDFALPGLRFGLVVVALTLAALGASVWHEFEKAAEYEEIDSALLADDLPINAYLDRGFQAWLEQHSSQL